MSVVHRRRSTALDVHATAVEMDPQQQKQQQQQQQRRLRAPNPRRGAADRRHAAATTNRLRSGMSSSSSSRVVVSSSSPTGAAAVVAAAGAARAAWHRQPTPLLCFAREAWTVCRAGSSRGWPLLGAPGRLQLRSRNPYRSAILRYPRKMGLPCKEGGARRRRRRRRRLLSSGGGEQWQRCDGCAARATDQTLSDFRVGFPGVRQARRQDARVTAVRRREGGKTDQHPTWPVSKKDEDEKDEVPIDEKEEDEEDDDDNDDDPVQQTQDAYKLRGPRRAVPLRTIFVAANRRRWSGRCSPAARSLKLQPRRAVPVHHHYRAHRRRKRPRGLNGGASSLAAMPSRPPTRQRHTTRRAAPTRRRRVRARKPQGGSESGDGSGQGGDRGAAREARPGVPEAQLTGDHASDPPVHGHGGRRRAAGALDDPLRGVARHPTEPLPEEDDRHRYHQQGDPSAAP